MRTSPSYVATSQQNSNGLNVDAATAPLQSQNPLPPGLPNPDNLCYLNSAIQCIVQVPELTSELVKFSGNVAEPTMGSEVEHRVCQSVGGVLRQLGESQSSQAIQHSMAFFLQAFRSGFPQFDERGERGIHKQQDANEAWGQLFRAAQKVLPGIGEAAQPEASKSLIDQLFGIKLKYVDSCVDNPDEASTESAQMELQLACNISKSTGYMMAGIELGLDQQIEKVP